MSSSSLRVLRSPAYDAASSSSFNSNASTTEFGRGLDHWEAYDSNAVLYPGLEPDIAAEEGGGSSPAWATMEGGAATDDQEKEDVIVALREENERLRQRLGYVEKMEKEKREELEGLKEQVKEMREKAREESRASWGLLRRVRAQAEEEKGRLAQSVQWAERKEAEACMRSEELGRRVLELEARSRADAGLLRDAHQLHAHLIAKLEQRLQHEEAANVEMSRAMDQLRARITFLEMPIHGSTTSNQSQPQPQQQQQQPQPQPQQPPPPPPQQQQQPQPPPQPQPVMRSPQPQPQPQQPPPQPPQPPPQAVMRPPLPPPNDEASVGSSTAATASKPVFYARASTLVPAMTRRDENVVRPHPLDDDDTMPATALSRSVTAPVHRAENVGAPRRQQLLYYVLQTAHHDREDTSSSGAIFRQQPLGPATVAMLQAAADVVKKAMSECAESILRYIRCQPLLQQAGIDAQETQLAVASPLLLCKCYLDLKAIQDMSIPQTTGRSLPLTLGDLEVALQAYLCAAFCHHFHDFYWGLPHELFRTAAAPAIVDPYLAYAAYERGMKCKDPQKLLNSEPEFRQVYDARFTPVLLRSGLLTNPAVCSSILVSKKTDVKKWFLVLCRSIWLLQKLAFSFFPLPRLVSFSSNEAVPFNHEMMETIKSKGQVNQGSVRFVCVPGFLIQHRSSNNDDDIKIKARVACY